MTLTELRYIIAVSRTHHFGRAAELCHVSQPSLSVAVKKLEEELDVQIFERRSNDITITPTGQAIIEHAQRIIEDAERLRECAAQGKDPLSGPLRLGVIFTIAPYLLPLLVSSVNKTAPTMPLLLTENYTLGLLEQLRNGTIDCAIMALPVSQPGLMMQPLFDEDFVAAVPANHYLADHKTVTREEIKNQPMLLLGSGHCFRDQVLEFCGETMKADAAKKNFEGTSLQTIVYMVSQGLGITILPASSVPYYKPNPMIGIINFEKPHVPRRRIVLVWRKSFPRTAAIRAITSATATIQLFETKNITMLPAVAA